MFYACIFAGWDEPDRPQFRLLERLDGPPPALRRRPHPDRPREPGGPLLPAARGRRRPAAARPAARPLEGQRRPPAPRRQPRPAGLNR